MVDPTIRLKNTTIPTLRPTNKLHLHESAHSCKQTKNYHKIIPNSSQKFGGLSHCAVQATDHFRSILVNIALRLKQTDRVSSGAVGGKTPARPWS